MIPGSIMCGACITAWREERWATRPQPAEKTCPGCSKTKRRSAFRRAEDNEDGLELRCRQCFIDSRKAAAPPTPTMKICARCLAELPAEMFAARRYGDRLAERCLMCVSAVRAAVTRGKREALALRIFAHYGMACACPGCGVTERTFLTIDHMDNDGAEHRRSKGARGYDLYNWLARNGYPERFQTLCRNCNWGKHVGDGVCRPHAIWLDNDPMKI